MERRLTIQRARLAGAARAGGGGLSGPPLSGAPPPRVLPLPVRSCSVPAPAGPQYGELPGSSGRRAAASSAPAALAQSPELPPVLHKMLYTNLSARFFFFFFNTFFKSSHSNVCVVSKYSLVTLALFACQNQP